MLKLSMLDTASACGDGGSVLGATPRHATDTADPIDSCNRPVSVERVDDDIFTMTPCAG